MLQLMKATPAAPTPPSAVQAISQEWRVSGMTLSDVVVETSLIPTPELRSHLQGIFPGRTLSIHQISRSAFQQAVLDNESAEVADHIANGFARQWPEFAARKGWARWQRWSVALVAVAAVTAVVLVPRWAFLILVVATSAVTITMALISTVGVLSHRRRLLDAPLADADLPTYTVLVPAYQEQEVIGDLVRCLHDLDYPKSKLEVLVLVERRDLATKNAIAAADPEPFIRVVELPPGKPQTKPRSCNAGLLLASGELLVIFDAEDRPEPDQLRKAAARFAAAGPELGCVQAKLLVHNANRNFITRQFALEYAMRYELAVPGLARLGLPIPLGGSSNHFRTDALRAMGGWDAWNVTEDADLGMRCQAMGYTVEVVDSVTWSESTETLSAWTKQRTRWLKGFLLTALVHSRSPRRTVQRFRPRGLVTLVAVVAGTPLHYLIQSVAFALWATDYPGVSDSQMPYTSTVALLLLVVGTVSTLTLQSMAAWRSRTTRRAAVFSPLLPIYWTMQWVAAWRALIQLIRAPFAWEKTVHGTGAASAASALPPPHALRREGQMV